MGEWGAWAEGLMVGRGLKRKDNAEARRALRIAEKVRVGRSVGGDLKSPLREAGRIGRAAVHAGIIDA